MTTLDVALKNIVHGDISYLPAVLACHPPDLLEAEERLSPLLITRPSLIRVLSDWKSGRWTANEVQQWASVIRHGCLVPTHESPRPVDIGYDETDEELIINIIARLYDIGDLIDGIVDDREREEMLRALQS